MNVIANHMMFWSVLQSNNCQNSLDFFCNPRYHLLNPQIKCCVSVLFPCFGNSLDVFSLIFGVLGFLGRALFGVRSSETAQFVWICGLSLCIKASLKKKLDFFFLTSINLSWRWKIWAFCELCIERIWEFVKKFVNFCGKRFRGYGIFSCRFPKDCSSSHENCRCPRDSWVLRRGILGAMSFEFLSTQKSCRPLMWDDVSCHEFVKFVNVCEVVCMNSGGLWHYSVPGFPKDYPSPMWVASCRALDLTLHFVQLVGVCELCEFCEAWCQGAMAISVSGFPKDSSSHASCKWSMDLILWVLWILWGMIWGSYGNFSFWVSK